MLLLLAVEPRAPYAVLPDNRSVRLMHPSLSAHMRELEGLCRQFSVRRLELFGSAARGGGEPRDLDFLVEFEPLPPGGRAAAYFGLQSELEALFGRPVDLVMTKAIGNRHFLAAIAPERISIYAA